MSLSPFASQRLHWRAARTEALPTSDERVERIHRLAYAAVLQDGGSCLDAVERPDDAAALAHDASAYMDAAMGGHLAHTNPPSLSDLIAVADRLERWTSWRRPDDIHAPTAAVKSWLRAWSGGLLADADRAAFFAILLYPAVLRTWTAARVPPRVKSRAIVTP